MAAQPKTVGGGSAKPLANDFLNFLRTGLNSGSFGGGAINSTTGIAGLLNDLLSGGAGEVGGALGQQIARQRTNDVASLRSRFGAGGGTAFGTPAAFAESQYLAQSAEQLPTALAGLQLSALGPLLGLYGQAVGIGTPQSQTVMQGSGVGAGLGVVADIASKFLPTGIGGGGLPKAPNIPTGQDVADSLRDVPTLTSPNNIDYESLRAAGLI